MYDAGIFWFGRALGFYCFVGAKGLFVGILESIRPGWHFRVAFCCIYKARHVPCFFDPNVYKCRICTFNNHTHSGPNSSKKGVWQSATIFSTNQDERPLDGRREMSQTIVMEDNTHGTNDIQGHGNKELPLGPGRSMARRGGLWCMASRNPTS